MTTTEKYFRALGWRKIIAKSGQFLHWMEGIDKYHNELPNITQSYPDFKRWVLEEMNQNGYVMLIGKVAVGGYSHKFVEWDYKKEETAICKEIIKDNEILEAAVIAATSYLEIKNGT